VTRLALANRELNATATCRRMCVVYDGSRFRGDFRHGSGSIRIPFRFVTADKDCTRIERTPNFRNSFTCQSVLSEALQRREPYRQNRRNLHLKLILIRLGAVWSRSAAPTSSPRSTTRSWWSGLDGTFKRRASSDGSSR
jgi:hypothetical protein